MARLERPKWWRAEREDSAKHIMLQSTEPLSRSAFLSAVRKRLSRCSKHEALLFVHGFRTSFPDAVRRTAQLAYDLRFPGISVTFSWPTRGTFTGYLADEQTIEWSVPFLKSVIKMLGDESGVSRIHILAHSMGSRAIARALEQLGGQVGGGDRCVVKQVVSAAPDIHTGVSMQLSNAMRAAADRITMTHRLGTGQYGHPSSFITSGERVKASPVRWWLREWTASMRLR